jgi:WD40 repeat protein
VRQTRIAASGYVRSPQFIRDGRLLRVTESNGSFSIWDTQNGDRRLTLPNTAIPNADWSRAVYWDDGVVHIADIDTGLATELSIIEDYVGGVASFSPITERAIFVGAELRMYDLSSGEQVFSEPMGEMAPWIQFNVSGERFLTGINPVVYGGDEPQTLTIWDTFSTQSPLLQFEIPNGHGRWILSPDGKYLSELNGACGDGGGGFHQLWDAETGDNLAYWHPGGVCGPYTHVFSADSKWLIVGWDFDVVILDVKAAIEEAASADRHFLQTAAGAIYYYLPGIRIEKVTLNPDGSQLAVSISANSCYEGCNPQVDYKIDLYRFVDVLEQTDSRALLETALTIPDARQAVFSPEGQWLLTDNGLWNAVTAEQVSEVSGEIAAFSPDGAILAVVAGEGVALWDVAALTLGEESSLTVLDIADVQELAFSGDGALLYVKRAGDIQAWGVAEN